MDSDMLENAPSGTTAVQPRQGRAAARRDRRASRHAPWGLIVAIVVAVVILFPVYWMIVGSLLPTSITLSTTPPIIPTHGLTLHAYTEDLTSRPVARWLLNSTFVTVAVVILSLFVSALAGYSLSRFRSGGTTTVGYTLLLARMLPGTMLTIPLFVLFGRIGLIDSLWSLVLADTTITVPFTAWMLKNFFDAIPVDLEHAAMLDGCSQLGALCRIVMPLAAPGIGATAAYAAILSWSDLLFARTLITDPNGWTISVGVTTFIGAHNIDWSGMLAAGTMASLPMVILFLLLEPFLVRGLTAGATTG